MAICAYMIRLSSSRLDQCGSNACTAAQLLCPSSESVPPASLLSLFKAGAQESGGGSSGLIPMGGSGTQGGGVRNYTREHGNGGSCRLVHTPQRSVEHALKYRY